MAGFSVEFLPDAADELSSLDPPVARRILAKVEWLADHLDVLTPVPLTGDLSGLFKLRVGSYRVLYSFDRDEERVMVHMVGHRDDIYRS